MTPPSATGSDRVPASLTFHAHHPSLARRDAATLPGSCACEHFLTRSESAAAPYFSLQAARSFSGGWFTRPPWLSPLYPGGPRALPLLRTTVVMETVKRKNCILSPEQGLPPLVYVFCSLSLTLGIRDSEI